MALPQGGGRSRRQHRLILLVLTAITLLSLDLSGFGPVGSAQRWVRDLLHPVTDVAGAIASPFANAWNAIFDYDDLERERDQLRAELDAARGAAMSAEAERKAFQRLLAATDITYLGEIDRETAAVVRGPVGNFNDDVITIDKGSQKGIQPGMAAVTGAGLVGRVDRVDATTANIQLLSDSDLIVGVRLASTGEVGLGHTDPDDHLVFLIDQGLDWPDEDALDQLPVIGSVVVTAASSRYPAEIPIGYITDVYRDPTNELAMIVQVEMANDVTDLSYVTVLKAKGVDQVPLGRVTPSTSIPLTRDLDAEAEEGSDP